MAGPTAIKDTRNDSPRASAVAGFPYTPPAKLPGEGTLYGTGLLFM